MCRVKRLNSVELQVFFFFFNNEITTLYSEKKEAGKERLTDVLSGE